jgi:hypothetical protein
MPALIRPPRTRLHQGELRAATLLAPSLSTASPPPVRRRSDDGGREAARRQPARAPCNLARESQADQSWCSCSRPPLLNLDPHGVGLPQGAWLLAAALCDWPPAACTAPSAVGGSLGRPPSNWPLTPLARSGTRLQPRLRSSPAQHQLWRMLALRAQPSPFPDGRQGVVVAEEPQSAPQLWACCRPLVPVQKGSIIELRLLPTPGAPGYVIRASELQPDPSVNHNHCCSSRKLLLLPLLACPVSPCLPAATQNPLLRRRGVTAICVGAIEP